MSFSVGIAGAGLAGRLLALECLTRGWEVTLFDQDESAGEKSCGWTAAGMMAPYTELESSEPLLLHLGLETLNLWPAILQNLEQPVSLYHSGTLVVAHPQDKAELSRFQNILQRKISLSRHAGINLSAADDIIQKMSYEKLNQLIPALSPTIQEGVWLPNEGHINNLEFFAASTVTFHNDGVRWFERTLVNSVQPYQIRTTNRSYSFDLVCDCRGLGAKSSWPGLRGVRGEVIWLQTTEVSLPCPVRLLHPRYPIYIVPRSEHCFVVGATTIESDDLSPITAQSMLELLSAAYTVHPGFAEARIVNTLTQCRPAFVDHQPKISYHPGLLKINGLYRHGYMIGPAVIQDALRYVEGGEKSLKYPELLMRLEENILCVSL